MCCRLSPRPKHLKRAMSAAPSSSSKPSAARFNACPDRQIHAVQQAGHVLKHSGMLGAERFGSKGGLWSKVVLDLKCLARGALHFGDICHQL